MERTYKPTDARSFKSQPEQAAAVPVLEETASVAPQPVTDRPFQPGDYVAFRSNSRGTVLAVNGNGVQVDFGLGSSWFSRQSLRLIKAAPVTE